MSVDYDVLVVGAGPVGLASAIELGMRGIKVLIIERNVRGATSPRAKTTNVRTRTHMRRWGIADRLADASPLGVEYPNDVIFVTRLADYKLAHFKDAFNAAPARSPLYPEHGQWIPQYTLENVLLEHAQSLPSVTIKFHTTLLSADQDDNKVTALLNDGDRDLKVEVPFMIGADGARSLVRDIIGAEMEGVYGLSRNYNIVFRAPGLAEAHPHEQAVMYWQSNSDGGSLVGPMDENDVWFFMPTEMKEGETLSDDEAAAAITKATGIELPYEILSTDEWIASELLANSYRKGRMFLAGDACHLHPPFGGYGMNMGVGDAVDLGWKLAAILQGWGGTTLLESYEVERRSVHRTVIDEAVANHSVLAGGLWKEGLEDDTPEGAKTRKEVGEYILQAKAREFHTLGTVLGLKYEKSPIIENEGVKYAPSSNEVYEPCPEAGALAPHAWLPDGTSLYDVFGQNFTLLVAEEADDVDVQSAVDDAAEAGVPLKVVRPKGGVIKELYGMALTLIRPDQHVAWRGDKWLSKALSRSVGQ